MGINDWITNTIEDPITMLPNQYTSSPESGEFAGKQSTSEIGSALLNVSNSDNVVAGRITSWIRYQTAANCRPGITVRNQETVFVVDGEGYYIYFTPNDTTLRLAYIATAGGALTEVDTYDYSGDITWAINTWVRFRFTWGTSGSNFQCLVEYQDESTGWTTIDTLVDANNFWSASSVNYCGLSYFWINSVVSAWFDDTQVETLT